MLKIAKIAVSDSPEEGAFWSVMLGGAVAHVAISTGQHSKLVHRTASRGNRTR